MRVGPGRDRQRHVRQPPALHLPRLLPAGLQGQRQGQSIRVTHLPDAIAHGVEIRAEQHGGRVELDDATGRARGVTYVREAEGIERRQRAGAVAVAGYSIETPRLLLHSTSQSASPTGSATTTTRSDAT